eukprot:13836119-Alexandrium_andersonii.AAC.1
MGRLGKPGEVSGFDPSAYGNPGIWNEQRRFLTINSYNKAAFDTPVDQPSINDFMRFLAVRKDRFGRPIRDLFTDPEPMHGPGQE